MKKIKAAIGHLVDRITYRRGDLAKSRRRAKHFRELTEREHKRHLKAERLGRTVRAERFRRRAESRQRKAIYWKGRIKDDLAAITNLNERVDKREAELEDWIKEHGVVFEGPNKVRGGTPHQRLRAAALKAMANYRAGEQPGYYSMEGGPRDYTHALKGYPPGRIWDCSTYADGLYFVCDLPSPSGERGFELGGWTGTEGEHGHQVSLANAKPGALILYGPFPHHHVEVLIGDGMTSGHGSPPVDPGIPDLFGDGDFIVREYV